MVGVSRVHGEHGGGYFGAEGAHGDLGRPVLPTGESDLAAVCMGGGWRKSVQASRYNLAEQPFLYICQSQFNVFTNGRTIELSIPNIGSFTHPSVCSC